MSDKELLKYVRALYNLREKVHALQNTEIDLKCILMSSLKDGQQVIGEFRVNKIFYDSCLVPSFTRSSHYIITINKI